MSKLTLERAPFGPSGLHYRDIIYLTDGEAKELRKSNIIHESVKVLCNVDMEYALTSVQKMRLGVEADRAVKRYTRLVIVDRFINGREFLHLLPGERVS
jgi:hypothetical protein